MGAGVVTSVGAVAAVVTCLKKLKRRRGGKHAAGVPQPQVKELLQYLNQLAPDVVELAEFLRRPPRVAQIRRDEEAQTHGVKTEGQVDEVKTQGKPNKGKEVVRN